MKYFLQVKFYVYSHILTGNVELNASTEQMTKKMKGTSSLDEAEQHIV